MDCVYMKFCEKVGGGDIVLLWSLSALFPICGRFVLSHAAAAGLSPDWLAPCQLKADFPLPLECALRRKGRHAGSGSVNEKTVCLLNSTQSLQRLMSPLERSTVALLVSSIRSGTRSGLSALIPR